ncbi:MAG TPA: class I SAM-dependent methyltransferase [Gallionella sp.]
MTRQFGDLVKAATQSYAHEWRADYEFVRWKLRMDPVFEAMLKRGLVPDGGLLLDIGCGLGALPAMYMAAQERYAAGNWPTDWPRPPQNLAIYGLELNPRKAAVAARALKGGVTIVQGDVREAALPACTVAVILDVLFYLSPSEQISVLQRVAQSIGSGGMLIMRECDAAGGWRFQATRLAEKFCCLGRGQGWYPLHYRPTAEWIGLLQELGFSVETLPMSEGTPFSNVLFRATRLA